MHRLGALVVFAFVGSVSPGPNNAVLWASGIRFGFRPTVPHVAGTALGIGALAVGVAAGMGTVLDAAPGIGVALRVIGSLYLLFIAARIVGAGTIARATVSHPLTVWQGAAFQWANPKAWIFAIAAVGTFVPTGSHRPVAVAALVATVMIVVVVSSAVWAVGGAAIGGVMDDERRRRRVGIALAALLVASVVLLWV